LVHINTLNYCFTYINGVLAAHYQFTVSISEKWYNLILKEEIMYFNLKPTKIAIEQIKLNPKEYAFVHLK